MKTSNRVISFVLLVVMLASMIPFSVLGIFAAETEGTSATPLPRNEDTSIYVLYEEDFNGVDGSYQIPNGENTSGAMEGWIYNKPSNSLGSAYIENGRMYFSGDRYDTIYRTDAMEWKNYTLEADFCFTDDNLNAGGSNYGWGGMIYNVQNSKKFQKVGITLTGNASANGMDAGKWTNNSSTLNKMEMSEKPELVIPAKNEPFRMKVETFENTSTFYYAMLNEDGTMKTDFIKLISITNIADDAQYGTFGFMTSSGGKLGAFWVDNLKCYKYSLYEEDFDDVEERVNISGGNNVSGVAQGWIYEKKSTNGAAYIENGRMYFSGSKYDVIYRDGGEVWGNYTLEADFCFTDENLYTDSKTYGWGGMLYNVQSSTKFQKVGITLTGNASANGYDGSGWTNNSSSHNKYEMSKNPDLIIPGKNEPFRMRVTVYNRTATFSYAMLDENGAMTTEFIELLTINNIPADAQTGSIGFMSSSGKLGAFWVDNIKCYSDNLVSFSENFTYEDMALTYDDTSTADVDEGINTTLGMQFVKNSATGAASIENGALRLLGGGTGFVSNDGIFFTMGKNWTNYALEADFTYNMAETGWSGILYRSTDLKTYQKAALTPFGTTYESGTAVLNGKLNGSWYKDGNGTTKVEYDASNVKQGVPARLRVEAVENNARLFIAYYDSNGKLGKWYFVHEINDNFAAEHMIGTVGVVVGAGNNNRKSDVSVDNLTVSRISNTERVELPPMTADIYEPVSGIVNPPVVVQTLTDTLPSTKGERPAVLMVELDGDLNVIGENGNALISANDFIDNYRTAIIPAFIIDSQSEAEALSQLIAAKKLTDCYIVATEANAGLVRSARLANEYTKLTVGAIIFDDINSAQARQNARLTVTENMSFVAISRAPLSEDTATYFATRQIAAWSYAENKADVYSGIANGYHAIISENAAQVYEVYKSITVPTVSGKPIVILHRGANNKAADPYPENTIMGITAAKEIYGADAVEIDTKLTKDGYIVLNHDATMDRTMNGEGNVSDYTLAELKAMIVDQIPGRETEIATFEELMILIRDMDLVVYCHTTPNDTLMASISYLITKYGNEDKVIIFTSKTQYHANNNGVGSNEAYGFENQPLVADGLIFVRADAAVLSAQDNDLAGIEAMRKAIAPINYQPFFYPYSKQGDMWNTESFYYQLSARGFVNSHSVTNGQATMDALVLTGAGAAGLLTDNPHLCDDYHYALSVGNVTLKEGQYIDLTQSLKMTVGATDVGCGIIQLDGDALAESENGYTLNHSGTVTVVYYADRTTDGGTTYRVYSAPVTVTFEHIYDNDCDTDCNVCGEGREGGHIYNSVVTKPTCTDKGYTTYTCACGDSKIENYVDALGHTYDNDFDATCNTCGEAREVPATEGELNRNISWSYADGVLTISGKGKIKNFSAGTAPWAELGDRITEVIIGEGITYIGSSAFYCMTAVESVTLPETLTAMGNYVFYGCSSLTSINIPANVTEIGMFAFRRSGITEATFAIGYGWSAGEVAFSLEDILAGGAKYLSTTYYKSAWTRNVDAEVEVLDPNYVDGGVCGNGNIKWSVTRLDNGKLKLTISGKGNMPEFGTGKTPWYGYASDIVEIEVTEGITAIGRCSFFGLKFVRKATVANTVTSIGDYAFDSCFLLKGIELPVGVTISSTAFKKTGLSVIPTV